MWLLAPFGVWLIRIGNKEHSFELEQMLSTEEIRLEGVLGDCSVSFLHSSRITTLPPSML